MIESGRLLDRLLLNPEKDALVEALAHRSNRLVLGNVFGTLRERRNMKGFLAAERRAGSIHDQVVTCRGPDRGIGRAAHGDRFEVFAEQVIARAGWSSSGLVDARQSNRVRQISVSPAARRARLRRV